MIALISHQFLLAWSCWSPLNNDCNGHVAEPDFHGWQDQPKGKLMMLKTKQQVEDFDELRKLARTSGAVTRLIDAVAICRSIECGTDYAQQIIETARAVFPFALRDRRDGGVDGSR